MAAQSSHRLSDLERIRAGLEAASEALKPFTPGAIDVELKEGGDPVTAADRAVDDVLRELLPEEGEGWLSEETVDNPRRLDCKRVWVVDPVDGTREFIQGIPEWCISVALVEEGLPVAGGIYNPASDEMVVGAIGHGVTLNGEPVAASERTSMEGAVVLASRSEVERGEWDRFCMRGFEIRPCGSVAYKLGLVAAGLVDATWSLVPKNEWDVAAGVALVRAAGGRFEVLEDAERKFNRATTRIAGLIAGPEGLWPAIRRELRI